MSYNFHGSQGAYDTCEPTYIGIVLKGYKLINSPKLSWKCFCEPTVTQIAQTRKEIKLPVISFISASLENICIVISGTQRYYLY